MERFWQQASSLALGLASLPIQRSHGLHLLAAHSLVKLELPLSDDLRRDWEAATARTLIVPIIIGQLSSALGEPVVLVKGAEIAQRYPDPAARGYSDIDILVQDLPRALDRLRHAGFDELNIAVAGHHVTVQASGLPIPVEVHGRLNWPRWATPPSTSDLIRVAMPSRAFPCTARTLPPDLHTVYVAAHAWLHCPLTQLADLVDIAALGSESSFAQLASRAAELRLDRLWHFSLQAGRAVFAGEPAPSPLVRRLMPDVAARDAVSHREHVLRQFAGGLAAPSPASRAQAIVSSVSDHLAPRPGESPLGRVRALVSGSLKNVDERSYQLERADMASGRVSGRGGRVTADRPAD
jgi:hypothetical protein